MSLIGDLFRFLFGSALLSRKHVSPQVSRKIKERWENNVKVGLESRKPSQLRQSLIMADKLLDAALKEVSEGEKMGERLKNSRDLFEWEVYDKLWKAHKVRNSLVHDLDYEPTYFVLEEAIDDLKTGLTELGVNI